MQRVLQWPALTTMTMSEVAFTTAKACYQTFSRRLLEGCACIFDQSYIGMPSFPAHVELVNRGHDNNSSLPSWPNRPKIGDMDKRNF